MMHTASFRFHGTLNDFLPHRSKNQWINYAFNNIPAVKDSIEAIGVPHVEVKDIFINDKASHFYDPLQMHDMVEIYPFTQITSSPKKFVLDVHLGKLAALLRLLGFDTAYQNNFTDRQIVEQANDERIVLTRDIGLLKHKTIQWGYWLRSQQPKEQAREVLHRFALLQAVHPFARCISCNGLIEPVKKEKIISQLNTNTATIFHAFYQCQHCGKIYWQGSHYEKMLATIAQLIH